MSGSGDPDGEGNVSDGAGTGEEQPGEGEADSCMAVRPRYRLLHGGAGTLKVTGVGRTRTITVYKENGRVDISNVEVGKKSVTVQP